MTNFTFKNKLLLIASVLLFIVLFESIFIINKQSAIEQAATDLIDKDLAILNAAHELKLSVVQVQQWLTDISATRAQDGLNDGMEVAQTYANQFHQLIIKLKDLDPSNADKYEAMVPIFKEYFATGNKMAQTYIDEGPAGGNVMMASFDTVAAAMGEQVDAFLAERLESTRLKGAGQLNALEELHTATIFGMIVVLSILGFAALQGRALLLFLGDDPENLKTLAEKISHGELSSNGEEKKAKGVFKSMIDMRSKLAQQLSEIKHQALETGRLKTALDNVNSPIIMADKTQKIIYLNHKASDILALYETEICSMVETFEAANTLQSSCLDLLRQSPSLIEQVSKFQPSQDTLLSFGAITLLATTTPVTNDSGETLGTVIELQNRTHQFSIEHEVASMVDAAKSGDLSQRINETNKKGFYLELAKGMNELLGQVESVFTSLADVMSRMSDGDFNQQLTGDYQGKFDDIKQDVNHTVVKLSDITHQLNSSVNSMHNSSMLIASKNDDLSNSAQQQAAALEQTAAAMEEITSTVQASTNNAESANQLISQTVDIAKKGESIVSQAIDSMSMINESSIKISEIIGVIDEIAFQTNLLALNASVEAARAGEQGRGFAVVATEVRNLAGRSATAAKEIKTLIEDSVVKVKSGTDFVNRSGDSLSDIVAKITEMEAMISEIVGASKEQLIGINEINTAVTDVDRLTQRNASLAQDVAGESTTMKNLATQAGTVISFFKSKN